MTEQTISRIGCPTMPAFGLYIPKYKSGGVVILDKSLASAVEVGAEYPAGELSSNTSLTS